MKSKKEAEFLILPVELAKWQFPELIGFCNRYLHREYLRTRRAPKEFKITLKDFDRLVGKLNKEK